MEKLTGLKKVKTAIFISGRGSNLKNLIQFSKTKKSPIIIDLVIANNCLSLLLSNKKLQEHKQATK